MGRIPPVFLLSAKRRPPKSIGATFEGQRPAMTKFTKSVRALRNSAPASRHSSMSRMCWGRRPSGPAAEPAGKERTARRTSDSSTDRHWSVRGAGSSVRLLEAAGCFSLSALKDSGEGTAGLSSDIRMRMAALTLPSSSLAETAWLTVAVELTCCWPAWV